MATTYDAIIIGTGQAGPSLAVRLASTGMKVAVIERSGSAAPASTPAASRPRHWSQVRAQLMSRDTPVSMA
jgi:choline dehydrogenase-like flavoprotein